MPALFVAGIFITINEFIAILYFLVSGNHFPVKILGVE